MVGIQSCGVYLPKYRLDRALIGEAWGKSAMKGEKAIANYDEDTLTMAVEAITNCLQGDDPKTIDALFLASTTFPYKEKNNSVLAATVMDFRRDIATGDFSGSLRCGSSAILAALNAVESGSAKKVVVAISESRLGEPDSELEPVFGDGAAAFLIGKAENMVDVEGTCSLADEFTDYWRLSSDSYVKMGDSSFISRYGYSRVMREAIRTALKKFSLKPADFSQAVLYTPDERSHSAVGRGLGFDPKTQVQDSFFNQVGNMGSAQPFLMLIAYLERAKPGERVLLVSYGEGADAMILKTTERIGKVRAPKSFEGYLRSKRNLSSYGKYVRFRNLLDKEPFSPFSTEILLWPEQDQYLKLFGSKCKRCSTVQFPINRVCEHCKAKDEMEKIRLSRSGVVYTFTRDHVFLTPDPPQIMAVVDLADGGRFYGQMTDCNPKEVKIDMPVELTFRKLHEGRGFNNYFWKSMPIRCEGEKS